MKGKDLKHAPNTTPNPWGKRKQTIEGVDQDPLNKRTDDPLDTPIELKAETDLTTDPIDTPGEAQAADKRQKISSDEEERPAFNPQPRPYGTK